MSRAQVTWMILAALQILGAVLLFALPQIPSDTPAWILGGSGLVAFWAMAAMIEADRRAT